jgi:hypothetical protein
MKKKSAIKTNELQKKMTPHHLPALESGMQIYEGTLLKKI